MEGGFIGVDIFFVISGFLISTIIFSSLEHDRFSIVEFYVRRVQRIFPALILVLVATFVLGWFVLFSDEYKQLGKHIAGGAGFVSNFILWNESGYFDAASETKPLLHLWSLGIEEQFYIFWPLLLAFVWKRHWSFLTFTAVIAFVSFTANIYLVNSNPVSAFYLPLPRFWELMVGGVLAYIALHRPELNSQYKNGQSILGFAFLFAALALLDKGDAFPGWWALLPTLGAFLIISAGPDAWLNQKILTNKVMVWFGLISYPLYLWHWVLLSYLRIQEGEPSREMRFAAVLASIVFAWLTYKFVENPIRKGRKSSGKTMMLLAGMVVLFGVGCFCFMQDGFEKWRGYSERDEYVKYFENSKPEWAYFEKTGMLEKLRSDCNFYDLEKSRVGKMTYKPMPKIADSCFKRDRAYQHSVLIWGDSHAEHLYTGLKNNLPSDWQTLIVASSSCHPNPGVNHSSSSDYCEQSNWFALKTIAAAKPDVVIVAQNLRHHPENMNEITDKLHALGVRRIIFTGPTPHWQTDLPRLIARKMWDDTPHRTYVGIDKAVLGNDKALQDAFPQKDNVLFVSLIDFFCDKKGCLTYIGDDRKSGITSWDYGHLTPLASDLLAKNLLVGLVTGGGNPFVTGNNNTTGNH